MRCGLVMQLRRRAHLTTEPSPSSGGNSAARKRPHAASASAAAAAPPRCGAGNEHCEQSEQQVSDQCGCTRKSLSSCAWSVPWVSQSFQCVQYANSRNRVSRTRTCVSLCDRQDPVMPRGWGESRTNLPGGLVLPRCCGFKIQQLEKFV